MKNYKLLGNCQVCGRLQAVNNGMSKHGYTVEQGWFSGVCSGQNYLPMQQDATITHDVVKSIAEEVADLTKLIADLETGKKHPKTAPIASHYKAEVVAFADAPKYQQEAEIQKHIFASKSRIKAGQQHAEMLLNLLKKSIRQRIDTRSKTNKSSCNCIWRKTYFEWQSCYL